jgi:hypothetical protein
VSLLPASLSELRALQAEAEKALEERVKRLRARFDGAIRYREMLLDHPEWTDEECLAFARNWHEIAEIQAGDPAYEGRWNDGVPYCRNDIAKANLGRA